MMIDAMSYIRERGKKFVPKVVDNHILEVVSDYISPRKVALEKVFSFVNYNHIDGDYLEFGCAGANTFLFAYEAMRERGLTRHMYAFDSFGGLPVGRGVDVHPDFPVGQFSHSQEEFEQKMAEHGVLPMQYTVVKGYYKDVLTAELREKLPIRQAAVVYVDCDLYESAKIALRFAAGWLQTGTVVCFDDYFCFNGDPDRGESLAKKEFLAEHRDISMRSYFTYGWAGKAFICKVDSRIND